MSALSHIAAFITGHSVHGCTGLTPDQRAFQQRSVIAPARWLPWNFPYYETFPYPDAVSLLAASLNNAGHYFGSRRAAFRRRHREAVAGLFSRYDVVILVAGSCGMELLNNLDLPPGVLARLHVFACGPVSRRRPATAGCLVVQGTRDHLSRSFHREADHRYPCPHMGYLAAPQTLAHFNAFCLSVLGRAS